METQQEVYTLALPDFAFLSQFCQCLSVCASAYTTTDAQQLNHLIVSLLLVISSIIGSSVNIRQYVIKCVIAGVIIIFGVISHIRVGAMAEPVSSSSSSSASMPSVLVYTSLYFVPMILEGDWSKILDTSIGPLVDLISGGAVGSALSK